MNRIMEHLMPGSARILLNADLGEGGNADSALMPLIDIANVACGAHAGNESTMQASVELAMQHSVIVSAHPAYPDRENFGRKSIPLPESALCESITRQIDRVRKHLRAAGETLTLVKPHGALYNDCAEDEQLATLFLTAMCSADENLAVIALANSALHNAAIARQIPCYAEGFADRRYLASGMLAPRSAAGACIVSADEALAQARQVATGATISTLDGAGLCRRVKTICVHGDNPNALQIAEVLAAQYKYGTPCAWA
ncbi:MAG: 5-oxoprolinase subunit PxpA [Pseudomonadales bacterium]